MYSESYMRQMEVTGLTAILEEGYSMRLSESVIDHSIPTPPEALEMREEGSAFDAVMRQQMSGDERALMRIVSGLLDDSWRFDTGKALRAELRRLFTGKGRSERRFYAAFHGLEKKVAACL